MARAKCFFDDVKKELECSVCQEQFSEINEPKILKCLHTFCKTCLEAWIRQHREGELSCPTCRQITECPNSDINRLPSNLFYKQMLEIVEAYSGQGQEDSSQCGNCEQKASLKFYCSDCNCFLCEHCAETHKKWKSFKEHHIKEIGSFDSSDVQDYARKANVCKKHKDELRYYCDKCKICICRDCAILEHQDHNKISFEQGLEKKKSEISKRMQEVETVGILLKQQKESLQKRGTRVSNSIDQATDEVHRFAEHCITLIRNHEATITKELLKHKASFSSEFSSQMSSLDEKVKDVNSSLEFGKDILERNNLPEILNVEETLERRFQDFLSSPEFSRCIKMNNYGVKYKPRDVSNIANELGKLSFSDTEPSLSIAQGKGLTEGLQGEDCTFTIVTKDWYSETTYSESDLVNVDIQSRRTGKVTKSIITDARDGCYEVKFRPDDAGEFRVSISVGGETIKDSPFDLKIFETSVNAPSTPKEKKKPKRGLSVPAGYTFPVKCGLCEYEEGTIEVKCVFRHRCCNLCRKSMPTGECTICEVVKEFFRYRERGDQPTGRMSWRTDGTHSLQGYERCGTLIVSCNFDRGVQDQNHPNPGVPYCCFFCTFYLPDNPVGRELCILLRRAFNHGLMFTVGTSPQTKEANSIVCNGLELKTSRSGGPSHNGYPDPSYLDRLKSQLAKIGFE